MGVECVDAAKDRLEEASIRAADLIGVHLPMHTATRLAGPVIQKARRLNPPARICAYGLYAPLNEAWLRSLGVDDVLGGEFEADLAAIAQRWLAISRRRRPSEHAAARRAGLQLRPLR